MTKGILVFDQLKHPLLIKTEGTVAVGEHGYMDGKIMKKTSDFQMFIKPIVCVVSEIPEEIKNDITAGKYKTGDEISF